MITTRRISGRPICIGWQQWQAVVLQSRSGHPWMGGIFGASVFYMYELWRNKMLHRGCRPRVVEECQILHPQRRREASNRPFQLRAKTLFLGDGLRDDPAPALRNHPVDPRSNFVEPALAMLAQRHAPCSGCTDSISGFIIHFYMGTDGSRRFYIHRPRRGYLGLGATPSSTLVSAGNKKSAAYARLPHNHSKCLEQKKGQ